MIDTMYKKILSENDFKSYCDLLRKKPSEGCLHVDDGASISIVYGWDDRFEMVFRFSGNCELTVNSSDGFEIATECDGKNVKCVIRPTMPDKDDIFTKFMCDLVNLVATCSGESTFVRVEKFAHRIKCWQEFMHSRKDPFSREKETGLFGELIFLEQLILRGDVNGKLNEIWQGPMHGAHDFVLGNGISYEIKTTRNKLPFTPKIDSLMQLDTSDCEDLRLVAIQLEESPDGLTIETLADRIWNRLSDTGTRTMLESLILAVGVDLSNPPKELCRFMPLFIRSFAADSLPRIIPTTVPGVHSAMYTIDLLNENGESIGNAREIDEEFVLDQP